MRWKGLSSAALVGAVVVMVSVAVTLVVVLVIALGAETLQVGGLVAPVGLPTTAQVRATLPTKPPVGVMVMVEVAARSRRSP